MYEYVLPNKYDTQYISESFVSHTKDSEIYCGDMTVGTLR